MNAHPTIPSLAAATDFLSDGVAHAPRDVRKEMKMKERQVRRTDRCVAVRELPHMISATFMDFLTPFPHVRILI